MNPIFFPHTCNVFELTVVTRDFEEVPDMILIATNVKCKIVEQKAKWINGQYVMERSDETSIIFESSMNIQKGYKIVVGDRTYTVSDIQPRNFASGYDGGKRATCKLQ